jgi:hypothetical protein
LFFFSSFQLACIIDFNINEQRNNNKQTTSYKSKTMLRRLQSLVIYDPITGQNYTGNNVPPDLILTENNPDTRPTAVVTCRTMTEENETNLSTTTLVQFYYNVETNTTNVTDVTFDQDFPIYLNGNMINAISEEICNNEIESSSSQNMSSTGVNCVLSISSGPVDERLTSTTCSPSIETSQSCTVYEGSIQIAHTTDCTSTDIQDDVLTTLQESVGTQDFLTDVNRRSHHRNGVTVTKVEITDSIYNESTGVEPVAAAATTEREF